MHTEPWHRPAVARVRLRTPSIERAGTAQVNAPAISAAVTCSHTQTTWRYHLLVHGAAGGVGTAAVQLAVLLGARVTATVRNPDARSAVAALGAHVTSPEDFAPGGSHDMILELVGGPNVATDVRSLAVGGRIVVIGIPGGSTAELNLIELMLRRGSITATTLRSRSLEDKALLARQIERHVLPAVNAGHVHVPLAAAYPLDQAADAYAHFAAGGKIGKIVLTL